MKLYLLRHANADTVAATDDGRPLSDKGVAQAQRVAEFCRERKIALHLVLTSPLPRALETAQIVAKMLGSKLQIVPWLASGMDPETAMRELRSYQKDAVITLVGHEPDFSRLAAHLLGLPCASNLRLRKASLTALWLESFRPGAATLEYSFPCKLM